MLRKGDCPSCTASACFKASSKTGSPVLLTKSANTIVSFSVSGVPGRKRKYRALPISPATITRAAGTRIFHHLLLRCGGPSTTLTAPDEAGPATADEEPGTAGGAA